MATASLGKLAVTGAWQDVVATYAGAASVDVIVQNLDDDYVDVFFGGASAPTTGGGFRLDTFDSVEGNAEHIWVRGDGTISINTV